MIANTRENARRDAKYGPAASDGSDASLLKLSDPNEKKKWGLEGMTDMEIIELGDRHPGAYSFSAFSRPGELLIWSVSLAGYRYII